MTIKPGFAAMIGFALLTLVETVSGSGTDTDLSAVYHRDIVNPALFPDSVERMKMIAEVYKEHFSRNEIDTSRLNDDDLRVSTMAAFKLTFYADFYDYQARSGYLEDAQARFIELKRRSLASTRDYSEMYYLLMMARMFNEAAELRTAQPELVGPPIPSIQTAPSFDTAMPGELVLNPDTNTFVLRNVDLHLPLRIVVIAGCDISKGAAQHVRDDPTLREAFRKGNAIWVGSTGDLDPAHIRQWNEELPEQPLTVAYQHESWRDIDFAGNPNFHFFRDGQMIASHSGWQPDGVPEPVLAALREMGLLKPAP